MLLEEAACSAYSKGLNHDVSPAVVLVDNLREVEKATGDLPEEMAELWQVAFKILKDLTCGEEGSSGLESQ